MSGPCKDCEHRRPGCHGECEVYKAWRAPFDTMRAEKKRARISDDFLQDGHYRGWRKYKRR